MAHIRQQVREAFRDVFGPLTEGDEIIQATSGGQVETPSEEIELSGNIGAFGTRTLERRITVVVTYFATATDADAVLDLLDDQAAVYETALPGTVGALVTHFELIQTETELATDTPEQSAGTLTMTFLAWARTVEGAPETGV